MLAIDLNQQLAVRNGFLFEMDSFFAMRDFLLQVFDSQLLLTVRQIGVELVASRSHLLQFHEQLLLLCRDPRRNRAVFFFGSRRIRALDSMLLHSRQFRLSFIFHSLRSTCRSASVETVETSMESAGSSLVFPPCCSNLHFSNNIAFYFAFPSQRSPCFHPNSAETASAPCSSDSSHSRPAPPRHPSFSPSLPPSFAARSAVVPRCLSIHFALEPATRLGNTIPSTSDCTAPIRVANTQKTQANPTQHATIGTAAALAGASRFPAAAPRRFRSELRSPPPCF